MTHPFHPLGGKKLAYIGLRYTPYGKRVLLRVEDNAVTLVPWQWTDLAALDPEVVLGKGRSFIRLGDLIALEQLVQQGRQRRGGENV